VGAAAPTDAQVLGAVNRVIGEKGTVVCAAGGLPGELHKLWRAQDSDAYHLEYGYSCMGYEIAGGLGVKLARPDRDVVVMVGDGSYLMMNSEIATSIALRLRLTVVLLDNRGFGCINRLQQSCGGASFNNLLEDAAPAIDFAAHARSLGAHAQKVSDIRELEAAVAAAKSIDRTVVIVIETDPHHSTASGGAWWDVAVPEVSEYKDVNAAHAIYRATLDKLP
ncbi:MAG: thiamine pyrophosphate-dependent enzyme, partial [Steroidobacter sp.]